MFALQKHSLKLVSTDGVEIMKPLILLLSFPHSLAPLFISFARSLARPNSLCASHNKFSLIESVFRFDISKSKWRVIAIFCEAFHCIIICSSSCHRTTLHVYFWPGIFSITLDCACGTLSFLTWHQHFSLTWK